MYTASFTSPSSLDRISVGQRIPAVAVGHQPDQVANIQPRFSGMVNAVALHSAESRSDQNMQKLQSCLHPTWDSDVRDTSAMWGPLPIGTKYT